ncbi:MAG: YlxR family protein [Actinomycetota bacterium]
MGTPIRTCAGCRRRRSQAELVRVVRRRDGSIVVGREPGRGAYVCCDPRCVEQAFRSGGLRRTLRVTGDLPQGLREDLEGKVAARHGEEVSRLKE